MGTNPFVFRIHSTNQNTEVHPKLCTGLRLRYGKAKMDCEMYGLSFRCVSNGRADSEGPFGVVRV